ncbi:carboxylesterase family protein [Annulohypoxylon truncatum]|uniref:carboxylesterase family protein n=1 Tax=Annulohypoxylon truncatum TaxID=327061 RepID=UPI002008C863|nr:carboxylesterase family protein [Annulohypoxylon truncatum]KAI1214153.1 carboxylesterase family protein [Annulohypoxylon truncatum]
MRPPSFFGTLGLCGSVVATTSSPSVVDTKHNVTYNGLNRNGVEAFLSIPYGQDTSGANRFKPPQAFVPKRGSTINAQAYGPACPQPLGEGFPPLTLTNVTAISEDCLHLNVIRPLNVTSKSRLPVLVYIYGGSFWTGQNSELATQPDGMVLESVENGLPIIHVAMNYRLGVWGFAKSDALKSEGSENAALRDQRLAIEWVRDNIASFGGDPSKITISGQSSGGLAVGMQIMAYGGSKPAPFQRGICESQALEPGITGNYTLNAMQAVANYVGCNSTSLHSAATVACLRNLSMETLEAAEEATYSDAISYNIGDIWLPSVDGDFLPLAPSQLIAQHKFAAVDVMMGWCQDDVALFTDTTIASAAETRAFLSSYLPGLSNASLDGLLALYPSSEFANNTDNTLSAEFFRTARVFRDVLMTCEPVHYGAALAAAGNDVYLYEWNQTILDPILAYLYDAPPLGVVHTSEFAYVFGNISHWDTQGYPYAPTPSDYALVKRGSRTWSTFASLGVPGLKGKDTFQGFGTSFPKGGASAKNGSFSVFVAGGPEEGFSAVDGPGAKAVVAEQKLRERCAYINSAEFIAQVRY